MPFIDIYHKPHPKCNSPLFYTDSSPSTIESAPASTTLLLIHGLGSSSCFYAPIVPLLTTSSPIRCIALDAYGSGLSPYIPSPAQILIGRSIPKPNIDSLACDAIALLNSLDVYEKVVVVGHSLGGIVASTLASKYPDRVKGVVLLGPVNPSDALAGPFEKRIEVVEEDGLEPLANSIPTAATGSKSTSLHHAFIRSLILGTSPEGYISLCKCIASASKPEYAEINVPLLLLAGAEDKTAPLESAKAIVDAYGTQSEEKRLEVLDGVGHWHCVEAPEEVAKHISAFVDKLS